MAKYRDIAEVPLEKYDSIFGCLPDENKIDLIDFSIEHKKHLLLEKPLLLTNVNDFEIINKKLQSKKIYLQTAYNHRFEPNILRIKNLLEQQAIGRILGIRIYYGNGTVDLVKNSNWRNTGFGVGADIGSHLLDMLIFWFGIEKCNIKARQRSFISKCPDYVNFFGDYGNMEISLIAEYVSWKNSFFCEISGSKGTLRMEGLCKWSESVLDSRIRVYPSGVPSTTTYIEPFGDKTWSIEQEAFFINAKDGQKTNLEKDELIQRILISAGIV